MIKILKDFVMFTIKALSNLFESYWKFDPNQKTSMYESL